MTGYSPPTALYVHVPLCCSKCRYCDFYSVPATQIADSALSALVDATLARLKTLSLRFEAETFHTIFIGGGTPTALPRALLDRLLASLARVAAAGCEWTVEANPESLDDGVLELFQRHGVNRVSVGVQSLDDAELVLLGRPHDAAQALAALGGCVASGFSVSADLIAGIPAPAPRERLGDSASRLLDLGIDHLSIYDLSLEPGTPLATAVERGQLRLPGLDPAYEAWDSARDRLESRGFRRYEISNFAPPDRECRHNLSYWSMESYLGVGPGAVSTLVSPEGAAGRSLRLEEKRDFEAYVRGAGSLAEEIDIGARDSRFEMLMMGFRTIFGLDLERFAARFGCEAELLIPRTLAAWAEHLGPGLTPPRGLAAGGRRLALDGRGLDLLNRFLGDCLLELEENC